MKINDFMPGKKYRNPKNGNIFICTRVDKFLKSISFRSIAADGALSKGVGMSEHQAKNFEEVKTEKAFNSAEVYRKKKVK